MENNKDYEKRLGRRLREAYLKDYEGPAMSRENFHRLIEAAEKKKNHNKAMIGLAAACVAICLVCGGFVAGMNMRESASAGKDDETKAVQQGDSVVIGSGVSENDHNVGVSTKTYTDIEDIPEDLREQIHFLDSDEFELEKVKVTNFKTIQQITTSYSFGQKDLLLVDEKYYTEDDAKMIVLKNAGTAKNYNGKDVYEKFYDECFALTIFVGNEIITASIPNSLEYNKKEVIVKDLLD